MEPKDRKAFAELLGATIEVYGTQLSATSMELWWNVLAAFPLAAVRAALSAHLRDPHAGRFAPKPADVVGHLTAMDGRPGAEEAWSMIPRDESASVVWTEEMAQAFGVAGPLLVEGDAIAARMAFLERYRALVQRARDAGTLVRWIPSLGHDQAGREGALMEAVERGRLTAQHVRGLLSQRSSDHALAALESKLGALAIGQRKVTQSLGASK